MKYTDGYFAFVAWDDQAKEWGPVAMHTPGWGWIPLTGISEKRLSEYRKLAARIAHQSGQEIHLIKFNTPYFDEIIEPKAP